MTPAQFQSAETKQEPKETTTFSARTPRASARTSTKKFDKANYDSSDSEEDFKPVKKVTQPRSAT
jgi:hypothetical protein